MTRRDRGNTRIFYGLGEQIAHDMVRREASKLGLEISTNAGCTHGLRALPRPPAGTP